VEVAVKNQDNREHDIFDSDDYLQDHGGMVATIRALTGADPKAWFGDTSSPARPKVRSLAEEAARVVRTRVLNPKWIAAMTRHGYKGAFELAATVDYLFGYDATAHVVEDWMYERVTEAYVGDPAIRKFLEQSNPWALRAMAERLLEAAERGLWAASGPALATLRAAVLEAEGWEEGR
jgi:cobaltochelatase CobN